MIILIMRKYWRLFPALGWMLIIFYLSSLQSLELTGELSAYDLILRKMAHVTEFGILVILFYWAFLPTLGHSKNLILSFVLSILYAVSDEIHQLFVPTREGKLVDILIDSLGILLATGIVQYWHGKNHTFGRGNPVPGPNGSGQSSG